MTTDEQRNYLLDAVDDLTKPVVSKVIQDGPIGSGLDGAKVVRVELPSLLDQLKDAIGGTVGIGGSKSLANERSMLDADALYRFALISSMIGEWTRMLGATITPDDPAKTLRAWYSKYEDKTAGAGERFYTAKMKAWKSQIEAKLNPARIRELPDACPVCGASDWWDPADKMRYLHPLIIKYRQTDADMIQQAEALCRACEQVWGVRQLAYELEQVAAAS